MTEQTPFASIPVAWLKPLPVSYKIPPWRWIVLPATTWMIKRRGGVWVSGTLQLTPTDLHFIQSKTFKAGQAKMNETWSIPVDRILQATVSKGLASETIEVHHAGGTDKLMAVRAGPFLDQLKSVVPLYR